MGYKLPSLAVAGDHRSSFVAEAKSTSHLPTHILFQVFDCLDVGTLLAHPSSFNPFYSTLVQEKSEKLSIIIGCE